MSAALASSTAADGHRAIIVAALMATYMQAVNISLPNAALLYIQGTLSMADDEVGWIFTSYIAASVVTMPMTRWLAGRYGRKAVYQISIAIFALGLVLATRATTPMQFIAARDRPGCRERHPRLRCRWRSCSICCRPRGTPASTWWWRVTLIAGHPQRSQHRRLAQRISRLALDVLFQPADGGLHLPGGGALASGEAGRAERRPSISSA